MKTILALITLSFSLAATPPDCQQTWRFSNRAGDQAIAPMQQFTNIGGGGIGVTGVLDNRYTQCNSWYLSYDNEGFSGLSVLLQSAPTGNGVVGSFATFAGTTLTGSNPSTTTTSASFSASGYYPYIQTTISSIVGTGSINLTVYGWKSPLFAGLLPSFQTAGNVGIGVAPNTFRLNVFQGAANSTLARFGNSQGSADIYVDASGNAHFWSNASGKDIILSCTNSAVNCGEFSATTGFAPLPLAFASLGTPANGSLVYCSDCTIAATCTGSGTGAIAKRLAGAWVCN